MKQKVVLITGASAGIGLSAAIQLMNNGVKVYAASRRGGVNKKAENGVGELIHVKMDVNVAADIEAVINQIMQENKQLDAIISNAGNGIAGSIEETSDEEMRYQFETNFFGAIKIIQACLPIFRAQGYGKVITTSSMAAVVPIPYQAFYSAVKSALLVFMQALYLEVKPLGIQCCTILPGDTVTEFTAERKYNKKSKLESSPYLKRMTVSVSKMEKDEQNGMDASIVGAEMVKQVMNEKMNIIVIPGLQYKIFYWLFNRLPANVSLWIVNKVYG